MVHANAVLTPRGRLLLARRVVEEGWPIVRAAEHFHVSWPTAKRWASRYAAMGEAGMTDRSSRPHRSPHRTGQVVVRKIVHLRWKHRLSPLAIASRLSMPASTVHAVLVRCRLNRLSHIDIRTGEPIRRYEHDHPGALIHVDVKKLGNIPDGGGWRFVGRAQGGKNRRTTDGVTRSRSHDPNLGHAFVHTVIDDHSRVAYAENGPLRATTPTNALDDQPCLPGCTPTITVSLQVAGLGLAGRVSGGRLALGCDSYNHSPRGCVSVDLSGTGAGGRR